MQASEKSGLAAKKMASVKRRKEKRASFQIPQSTHYPANFQKNCFSCQNVKCQSAKMCGVEGIHTLTMFVWLCTLEAKRAILSVVINCQNWPITGYTNSWYTGMKYWKQCLHAPHLCLSPAPSRFSRNVSRFAFPAILELGTIYAYTDSDVWYWEYVNSLKITVVVSFVSSSWLTSKLETYNTG